MKPLRDRLVPCIVVYTCLHCVSHAADIVKLQNTNQLDNSSSWSGSTVPTAADVMVWNSTYTTPGAAASLSQIGTSLSVSGIKVSDVGGTRNLGTTMVGYQNTSSAATLTLGADGIDMSAATQSFHAQSRILIGANQTWNIANANTNASPAGLNNNEDLSFLAQGAAIPFDFGGRTVTTSGAGQITVSSGYTMSNGSLSIGNNLFVIQGGTNRVTTLNNTLNLSVAAGSTLRLQSNSGPLTSAAPINLSGNLILINNNGTNLVTQSGNITMAAGSSISSSPSVSNAAYTLVSGNIAVNGNVNWNYTGTVSSPTDVTGAISGSGNITYINSSTNAGSFTRLSGSNSAYSGTISLGGTSGTRVLRLNSSNSGSANARWNIGSGTTLQVNGVSPQLGTLEGSGTVTNSHASNAATLQIGSGTFSGVISNGTPATHLTKVGTGTLTLTGANTYTGATTVNAGTLIVGSNTSGSSAVTVADGAKYVVNVTSQNDDILLTSLSSGTTTGTTIGIQNGGFLNPSSAPINTGTLTINAPTLIDLTGIGFTVGSFPLIAYGTIGGSVGYGGLSLQLPPRIIGSLVSGPSSVNVNITSVESIKWKGSINQVWDIDPTGTGVSGTANWLTTQSASASRYIQGTFGTDGVLFDDSADGSGDITVDLSTTLSPMSVTVNNPTRNYRFVGTGLLAGTTGLMKQGAGDLRLANTAANTYTGITTIDEGSITLGDGVTPGAGNIAGAIENDGNLVLNRPDNFTLGNSIIGTGGLVKQNSNAVTISSDLTVSGPLHAQSGNLKFTAGSTLSGVMSGSGTIDCDGGTLRLSGVNPNTHTGNINVAAGVLRLEKSPDVTAVSGDIYVNSTANGSLLVMANNQIADHSNLYFYGSAGDPMVGSTGNDVVNNVLLSTTNGTGGQLVLKNNFTIAGTATLTSGVLGAGSGTTATMNAVVITSPVNTILRVAGSSAATTLTIGSGGILAAGGEFQIKFNTANNDAVVNLLGDITTTGNFNITNGGYTGINLNVINLNGERTFNIGADTTTTIAPDIADTGDFVKAGAGKLVLGPLCTLGHTGATKLNAGTLIVNGSLLNIAPTLLPGTTLGGSGNIAPSLSIPENSTLSPGDGSAAILNFGGNVSLDAGSNYAVDITGATACDKIKADAGTLEANGTIVVSLGSYVPVVNDSFDIADATTISGNPVFDFAAANLTSGLQWDTSQFISSGVIRVIQAGYASFAESISDGTKRGPADDPDSDGINNLLEYALGGNPNLPDPSKLPLPAALGSDLVVTFSRRDLSETDTTQVLEISTDLSTWPELVPITPSGTLPSGVTIDVQENADADDTITVTIAKGAQSKRFVRMKVVK
jgi:autotransporter-associated beta strand protein